MNSHKTIINLMSNLRIKFWMLFGTFLVCALACNDKKEATVSVSYVNLTESSEKHEIIEFSGSIDSSKTKVIINVDTDPATSHPFEGIGGTFNELGWQALEVLEDSSRQEIMKNLFSEEDAPALCLNRIPIGASDFGITAYSHSEVNDDWDMESFNLERDEKCLMEYIKAAQQFNEKMKFHASPWSPPAWMKENRSMIGRDSLNVLRQDEGILPAYAKYFVKFCEGYKNHGITIDRLFVQNEAGNQTPYPSCRIDAEQMMDFITHHLSPLMQASESKETKIWTGTFNTGFSENSINDHNVFLKSKDFMSKTEGFGFQYASLKYISEIKKAYPHLKLMHTESECQNGANSPDEIKRDFQDFVMHMRHGVENFTFWNMVLPEPRKSTWGWAQNSLIVIDKETKETTYMPSYALALLLGKHLKPGDTYVHSMIEQGQEHVGELKFKSMVDRWMKMQGKQGEQLVTFQKKDGTIIVVLLNQGPEVQAEIQLKSQSFNAVLPANKLCLIEIKQ